MYHIERPIDGVRSWFGVTKSNIVKNVWDLNSTCRGVTLEKSIFCMFSLVMGNCILIFFRGGKRVVDKYAYSNRTVSFFLLIYMWIWFYSQFYFKGKNGKRGKKGFKGAAGEKVSQWELKDKWKLIDQVLHHLGSIPSTDVLSKIYYNAVQCDRK